MSYIRWAEATARQLLAEPLPRRWAHTQGVAAAARSLSGILGEQADLIEAAAWLHDIGYSPAIARTGFHPIDGARYLRDTEHADDLLCRLVAHHSFALNEAVRRGLGDDLADEFPAPPDELADAITYCDMTTGPDGQRLTVGQRLAEILSRYGPSHTVSHAITASTPQITAAVVRVKAQFN
jgi:hypothetical protein